MQELCAQDQQHSFNHTFLRRNGVNYAMDADTRVNSVSIMCLSFACASGFGRQQKQQQLKN